MFTPRSRHSMRVGFTLIELMAGIAIVAILALILLVCIQGARDNAEEAKCSSNLRQLATASQLFSQDHGGMLPALYAPNPWYTVFLEEGYVDGEGVFFCPSAMDAGPTVKASTISYGYNIKVAGSIYQAPSTSTLRLQNYNSLILFADSIDAEGGIDQYYIEKRKDKSIRAGDRHQGQIQYVRVDGSVDKGKPEDLVDDKYWIPAQ